MATKRVTVKDLEALAQTINTLTGSPMTYSDKQPDGRFKSNAGHYHIDGEYGGWALHRVHNELGGVITPIGGGFYPARDLHGKMLAYLSGLEDATRGAK